MYLVDEEKKDTTQDRIDKLDAIWAGEAASGPQPGLKYLVKADQADIRKFMKELSNGMTFICYKSKNKDIYIYDHASGSGM